MKLIIDIPEEKELIDKALWYDISDFDDEDLNIIREAIAHGTPVSAEGEYIKKEDALFKKWQFKFKDVDGEHWFVNVKDIENLPTYSFPDREKGEQLYSDLLRVKHGTMNIDSLIDKVYADMRGKANE